MPHFLIDLLSPFILLTIIVVALCSMTGMKAEFALRPLFSLFGYVIVGVLKVLCAAFQIIFPQAKHARSPFLGQSGQGGVTEVKVKKNQKIKIIVDDD